MPLVERASNSDTTNSVVFSLKNQVGGLARALQVFQARFSISSQLINYVTHTIYSNLIIIIHPRVKGPGRERRAH